LARFRTIWVWVILAGLTLTLLSSNSDRKHTWNSAEKVMIELTAPFQKLVQGTMLFTKGIWLNYFYLVDLRKENNALKNELDSLRMENSRYREWIATRERLEELLRFKAMGDWPAVGAQVIGRDPAGWFRSVMIDKGTADGIRLDMPAVDGRGVVGRVIAVSKNYSKILLIIDQNSAVDCLIQRSRDRGILKGTSTEVCKLDYVGRTGDALEGDMVVTSGLGGVFPKGLPVGRILKVKESPGELFKDVDLEPLVNFSKLEEVLVILKERESFGLEKAEK
jgi:rod shape-determining protein MreC